MSAGIKLNATKALKHIAASQEYRSLFSRSEKFQTSLKPAALRYIVSEERDEMFDRLSLLNAKGYATGIEFAGEEALSISDITRVTSEYLTLIKLMVELGGWSTYPQLGFDLSNVGSGTSKALAIENCSLILDEAEKHGISVIISMERSKWTDIILDIFTELSQRYSVIGITMQAQLHRTSDDLKDVLKTGRKVRLVKGVYDEDPKIALPRGEELNDRYLGMVETLSRTGHLYAYASQDPHILKAILEMEQAADFNPGELEMLHGVNPAAIREAKQFTRKTPRVSAVYGTEWFLHLLHRIAESPDNIYLALADIACGQRPDMTQHY